MMYHTHRYLKFLFLIISLGLAISASAQDTIPLPDTLKREGSVETPASPLTNLGKNINTSHNESAPVITPDGSRLYFWSDRPEGMGFMDIFYADTDDTTGYLKPAKNIGKPLNDAGPNLVLSISNDGRSLLIFKEIAQKFKDQGYSNLAIARRFLTGWMPAQPIKIEGFVNTGSASLTAYMGADGNTLVLSYVGPDTKGQEDLYVTFLDPKTNQWSKPKNLGNILNTGASETTPFIAADGLTLYFSSDRPGGLGGYDVYMTQRLDSTWQNWTPPQNLGEKINSAGDELHFKFPASADFGYLVSTHAADTSFGGKDIYMVHIPPEAKPRAVTMVKGKVIDRSTNKPMEAKISYILLPSGEELGSATSDSETGEYTIILPAGFNFAVLAEGNGYLAISENFNTIGEKGFNNIRRDLYLVPMKVGEQIRLNNLFFATGKANIKEESTPELQRLVAVMKKNPGLRVEVAGHTDNIGTDEVNNWLSSQRAEAVKKFIVSQSIEADRIEAKGYGSHQPAAPNDTEENRQQNRRVEFKLIAM